LGLLVATSTALLIYIQPQLKQNPDDKIVELLFFLIAAVNNPTPGSEPPTLTTWEGAGLEFVAIGEFVLYICLCATLCSGLYVLIIKFFTGRYGLGWRNKLLDSFTRWIFFVMYVSLAVSFSGTLAALTFQIILNNSN
jgi:hypothetical protein